MDGRSPRAGRALEVLPRRAVRTLTFPGCFLEGAGGKEVSVQSDSRIAQPLQRKWCVCPPHPHWPIRRVLVGPRVSHDEFSRNGLKILNVCPEALGESSTFGDVIETAPLPTCSPFASICLVPLRPVSLQQGLELCRPRARSAEGVEEHGGQGSEMEDGSNQIKPVWNMKQRGLCLKIPCPLPYSIQPFCSVWIFPDFYIFLSIDLSH